VRTVQSSGDVEKLWVTQRTARTVSRCSTPELLSHRTHGRRLSSVHCIRSYLLYFYLHYNLLWV